MLLNDKKCVCSIVLKTFRKVNLTRLSLDERLFSTIKIEHVNHFDFSF